MKMSLYEIYEKLLNKMLELFPDKNGDVVYHYTSLEVLWKFLKPDYDFLCTYCRDLSDNTEFRTGMFEVARLLKKHSQKDDFIRTLSFMNALAGDQGCNYLPWTMSFSLADDDTGQWRLYTDSKHGGYAVGFCVARIKNGLCEKDNKSHDTWALVTFLPCVYRNCDGGENLSKLFKFALGDVAYDLKSFLDEREAKPDNEEIARSLICFLLASLIKHEDFVSEREWRLIVQPLELGKLPNAVSMEGGRIRMATGLWGKDRKVSDCISRVVVSPQGHAEHLLEMGQLFAALRGLQKAEEPIVVPSESPYAGI